MLFLTFPVAVWLIDGSAAGRFGGVFAAAIAGWFFGFGYFLAGLYWVGHAFLVDAKTFGWLLPFAVTALPAGLAIFTAAGFAFARLIWPRGAMRIIALAVALTVAEWLRGHVLSGFPWNSYGYALTGPLVLAQSASCVGLWGLTSSRSRFSPALQRSPTKLADTRRRWLPLALGVITARGHGGLSAHGGCRKLRHDFRRQCAAAHHAAQPAAGREIQLRRRGKRSWRIICRFPTARPVRRMPACAT